MSKEQNRKFMNAYEKMLQDGTAFKEVDMRPEDPTDEFNRNTDNGLGDIVNNDISEKQKPDDVDNVDYSKFDSLIYSPLFLK